MNPSVVAPTATSIAAPVFRPIPVRDILPWAIFAGFLMLFLIYFVVAEGGATALIAGNWVHEFVHDSRHLLGMPCH